jgi:hypothetical protein
MSEKPKKLNLAAAEAVRQLDLIKAATTLQIPELKMPPHTTLAALSALDANPDFRSVVEQLSRTIAFQPPALSPEISAIFSHHSSQMAELRESVRQFRQSYVLPQSNELQRLVREIGRLTPPPQLIESFDAIKRAMEAMRTPWLDIRDNLKSLAGFAELQNIGLAMRHFSSFSDDLSATLRSALGDWRDAITFPKPIFDDAIARSRFYVERGFDSVLTDFPADAFAESATLAGIITEAPPLVEQYRNSREDHLDDAALQRTKAAYERLLRFETQIRKFIDEAMTAAFGADWIKHQVHPDLPGRWRNKKEQAERDGDRQWPLIAYADFTDYVEIITRRDNWERAFKHAFGRMELVRESFQRMYPIRICTMHARLITPDDELYLHAETTRILKAIRNIVRHS